MQRAGILGGGQLGRMLLQAAANYPVETFVLEIDPECPAAHLCHHFTKGDITSFDDVYNFGKGLDTITIEIESVNVEALIKLEKEGVRLYPSPSALSIVKNKILQKQFYQENQIPTADFKITQTKEELKDHISFLPAVHKLAMGGYDGRGVIILKSRENISNGFNEPAILEKEVYIKKEISLIIAINEAGDVAIYPPVEMIFNKDFNLLEYQLSPAQLDQQLLWKAEAIALTVVKKFKSAGIFAVEMFLDMANNLLVNEIAPRVHNSGHHTIESNYSSQFDMLWRIMLGYPLGNTDHIISAAIVNLIGEENYSGKVKYDGLEKVLEIDNVFVHIYGKKETRPGRKMGHITILSNERQELIHTSNKIKSLLKVISD
ncbi:MAG TPA: 5-(carboxyamino)imidazole ribonucleotide synthase [Chitinophagaceae bacterium]|nr:5-(carboxyamino)imidazole ribonucleotide synthase [Chitinophagaceae bacterium]